MRTAMLRVLAVAGAIATPAAMTMAAPPPAALGSAAAANAEISGLGCNVFFGGEGLLATSTTDECNAVATAMNKLDGVSNVTCHYLDSMQPHYDHVLGAGTQGKCNAAASALNKLNSTLRVGCAADFPNPGLYLATHVGAGVLQCTATAARLTSILQGRHAAASGLLGSPAEVRVARPEAGGGVRGEGLLLHL